jgi:hypothetical protein
MPLRAKRVAGEAKPECWIRISHGFD